MALENVILAISGWPVMPFFLGANIKGMRYEIRLG